MTSKPTLEQALSAQISEQLQCGVTPTFDALFDLAGWRHRDDHTYLRLRTIWRAYGVRGGALQADLRLARELWNLRNLPRDEALRALEDLELELKLAALSGAKT